MEVIPVAKKKLDKKFYEEELEKLADRTGKARGVD